MSTVVEALVIALGLDASNAEKGLRHFTNGVRGEAAKLDAALTTKARGMANNFLAPFKQLVGPIVGALSFGTAVNEYTATADAVGKLSDSIGVDMESLQTWGEAAKRAGGTVQGLQNTVQTFNQKLQTSALAGGGDEADKVLRSMGIAATDAAGKARDVFAVLRDMAGAAEGLSKAEFKGLAEKLGIDRGTIMLLQQGRTSLDDLIKRQKELGVYTKEDAEIAAKFNDAAADMSQVLKAASAGLMRAIIPAMSWLYEKLTIVIGFFRDNKEYVISTLGVITIMLTAKFIPALISMARNARLAMAPFAPFIALAIGLGLVIDDLWAYIEGGDSALSELWSQFGTGEEISQALSAAWEFLKGTAVALFGIVKPVLRGIGQSIDGLVDVLAGFVAWIRAVFNGDMQAATDAAGKMWQGLEKIISAVWEALKSVIKNALTVIISFILGDEAAQKFGEKYDALISKIEKIWTAIENVFSSALSFIRNLFVSDAGPAIFETAWNGITQVFQTLWSRVQNIFSGAVNFIKNLFGGETGAGLFKAAWQGITEFFADLWDGVIGIFENGVKIIKGLWNGIKDFFGFASETAGAVVEGVKEVHNFYTENNDRDWEAEAEDMANAFYYRPNPADSVSPAGLNAANGKTEQTVNNTTDIKIGDVTIQTQATDADGISRAFVDNTKAKWGQLVMPAQSGVNLK